MAKITIDASLCTGCGLCASNYPEIFEVGDDNIARVKSSGDKGTDLKDTAEQCPVSAITVK